MLRNLLVVSALTLLSGTVSFAQVSVGIKGSVQLANQKYSSSGISIAGDNMVGFQAGLLVSAPLTDQLSLRPQLLYSTKGTKLSGSLLGGAGETKTAINYLELPIQLAYSLEAGNGNVVIGAGPYWPMHSMESLVVRLAVSLFRNQSILAHQTHQNGSITGYICRLATSCTRA